MSASVSIGHLRKMEVRKHENSEALASLTKRLGHDPLTKVLQIMRASYFALILTLKVILDGGCTAPPPATPSSASNSTTYPYAGPNGGELIQLGDREFFAELMVNETSHDISIVILDEAAKKPVSIDSSVIIISLKHQGKPELHKLTASPLIPDGDRTASRFVAKGAKHLHADLEQVEADAHLEVTINGQFFRGRIAQHRNSRLRTR